MKTKKSFIYRKHPEPPEPPPEPKPDPPPDEK
jgi:hypothetical protein